jgi:hypothetical protein
MGNMNDYDAELYQQVVAPLMGSPARGIAPVKPADSGAAVSAPATNMGLVKEWRTRLVQQPRESLPLFAATPGVQLTRGAVPTDILTYTMSERNTGYLQSIRLVTLPPGSMQDVKWSLFLGQSVLAQFSQMQFITEMTLHPIPFLIEICANRVLTLRAQLVSTSLADHVTCAAMFNGWFEYISQDKPYGNTPASGIG